MPVQCEARLVGEVLDMASAPAEDEDSVRRFVASMTDEERMLVVLNSELYEDSWDEMLADLQGRLDGCPYIFKLAHRIEDDLARIARLREFEDGSGVKLSDYVKLET